VCDLAADLCKDHVLTCGAVQGESSRDLLQVLETERERVCVLIVPHDQLVLHGLCLDATAVAFDHLTIDSFFDVL